MKVPSYLEPLHSHLFQLFTPFSQTQEDFTMCRHLLQPVVDCLNLRVAEQSYRIVSDSINSSALFL